LLLLQPIDSLQRFANSFASAFFSFLRLRCRVLNARTPPQIRRDAVGGNKIKNKAQDNTERKKNKEDLSSSFRYYY
jgi:hypothetical protein